MHLIKVESALGQILSELAEQAILQDSQGRALGLFSPLSDMLEVPDLQLEPPLSISETQVLRKDRSGKPLSEILARLGLP